jgi:ABC-type multidrug transport system ATPase subunit
MRITTHNLAKRYNREWIFRNVNLTLESGNTYAITGPNGSGKSTLLQVLWGQLPPSSGNINYWSETGEVPAAEIFHELSIASPYMDLIDELTLEETVNFHFKFKKPIGGMTIAEIIGHMELGHAKGKTIQQFSSGMRQRLKLALAFFSETRMLFLDEPTTNLDENGIAWYHHHLRGVLGRLVLIASNQEEEYGQNAIKIHLPALKDGLQTSATKD